MQRSTLTLATVERVRILGPAAFRPTMVRVVTDDGRRAVVPRRWVV